MTRTIRDFEGARVRLEDERLLHILEDHPELGGHDHLIDETLELPEKVVQSMSDRFVRLYYSDERAVLGKRLCVVVKKAGIDAFVLTAYVTDRVKKGAVVWQKT